MEKDGRCKMKMFIKELEELGLPNSRTKDIALAVADLHEAICKLDYDNLVLFKESFSTISDLLDTYAEAEELRLI